MAHILSEFPGHARLVSEIVDPQDLPDSTFGSDDLWIVTHWTTAHSVEVATRLGIIPPARVTYLVQDYEPGFNAWSTTFALAKATYHAGFRMVINSTPVAEYLADAEGIVADPRLVFRPQLDLVRLERAANARERDIDAVRVLFYARPDKPRNLYAIGMSALDLFVSSNPKARVTTAGGTHPLPKEGPLSNIQRAGKTSWDAYFGLLSRSDITLALQYSPHPSHPPLDSIVSGAWAVTNELGGVRAQFHPRLIAAEPDPASIAKSLERAARESPRGEPGEFSPKVLDRLGSDVVTVVEHLAEQVHI